ncbi:tRNA (guanosine(37)-N1)-methyltransferase TrmD [Candidatus Saganbacteria bacterium]|nr:tRNA (guanosine(37)-N1)-methyltransferase TrmD [Candidatus Saganbacteria bacterium]
MRVDILTLFLEMFRGPLNESLLKKAQEKGLLSLNLVALRNFTADKHKTADDTPYGGGAGMVMKANVVVAGIISSKEKAESRKSKVESRTILLCPTGKVLTQAKVNELANYKHLTLICGHYEGIDERIRGYVDEEISIGDYVLTGGEIPALVLIDAVARQLPGVVKEADSVANDSFYKGLLDYPSYTKPEEFEGHKVPEVLLSGHHEEIKRWRRKMTLKLTLEKRPELLAKIELNKEDRKMLEEICRSM